MDKKLNTGAIVTSYIIGAIALTLGILTCVFSGNSGFHKTIIMMVGIIVVVIASIDLLGLIRDLFRPKLVDTSLIDYHRSLMSAVSLAIGIIVIIVANNITSENNGRYADIVFDYISLLAGISLVVVGATTLLKGIIFAVRKDDVKSKNIYRILGGIILLVAGILVLCLIFPATGDEVFHIFFMMLGIYIIIFALAIILVTTNTLIIYQKAKKITEAAIDEIEENEETQDGENHGEE